MGFERDRRAQSASGPQKSAQGRKFIGGQAAALLQLDIAIHVTVKEEPSEPLNRTGRSSLQLNGDSTFNVQQGHGIPVRRKEELFV